MNHCHLCPRNCGVDRTKQHGFCRTSAQITLARAALHQWEEPCISGKNGSGTVFFVGCNLGCSFCQNKKISRGNEGVEVTAERFREILFALRDKGAENINLVTPMHFATAIVDAISPIKKERHIPIVCNTGGYDTVDTVKLMANIVDCFLPDFKFATSESAELFCCAPNYPQVALSAIKEMVRNSGKPLLDERGMLKKGTLVRHLILPGQRKDSIQALNLLSENIGCENILLSLMSQYTPQPDSKGQLARKITEYEYRSVLEHALKLGFDGYMQDRSSAETFYTPSFNLEGVLEKN